jgi:hypothetical protein
MIIVDVVFSIKKQRVPSKYIVFLYLNIAAVMWKRVGRLLHSNPFSLDFVSCNISKVQQQMYYLSICAILLTKKKNGTDFSKDDDLRFFFDYFIQSY